jgi:hypothetical protein
LLLYCTWFESWVSFLFWFWFQLIETLVFFLFKIFFPSKNLYIFNYLIKIHFFFYSSVLTPTVLVCTVWVETLPELTNLLIVREKYVKTVVSLIFWQIIVVIIWVQKSMNVNIYVVGFWSRILKMILRNTIQQFCWGQHNGDLIINEFYFW